LLDDRCDPLACTAVTERKRRRSGAAAIQPAPDRVYDSPGIRADQLDIAAGDRFGALGLVAKHQQGHAQRRRFLLNPARIAEHQVGPEHRLDRFAMAAWRAEADRKDAGEHLANPGCKRRVGMEDHLHSSDALAGQGPKRPRNRVQPLAPILAPVAGDQKARKAAVPDRGGNVAAHAEHGVDPAVAGDMDLSAHPLAPKVGRAQLRGREQQVGVAVDRDPKFFLWPGAAAIMASKAGFDMSERSARHSGGKRSAERTGCVALHHEQFRAISGKQVGDRLADQSDVNVRVFLTGAAEPNRRIMAQTIIGRLQPGVLTGQDQFWSDSALRERIGDGGELDRFGTSADDDRDAAGQPSP
jgi:hypothetical protein